MTEKTPPVMPGKGDATSVAGAQDRRPIHYNATGSSCSNLEPRDHDPINGSSIQGSFVSSIDDDKSRKGTRKAQALKANLAKRKQQQRARVNAASVTPNQ